MAAHGVPFARRGFRIATKRLRPSVRCGCRRAASSAWHIASLPAPGSCSPPGFVGLLDPACESSPTSRGQSRQPHRTSAPQSFRRRFRSILCREWTVALHLVRHSCRGKGGIPPECEEVDDDAGIRRRKSDATAQRRQSRRPLRASRRLKRNRRVTAPRAAMRCQRMRCGADLAANMTEGRDDPTRTFAAKPQPIQSL